MNSPFKIVQTLRQKVQAVTYGSPLYRLMLDQGGAPDGLLFPLPDLWPGDAARGAVLLDTSPGLFDSERGEQKALLPARAMHNWLRDLRAVGSEAARRKAAALLATWLQNEDSWQESVWAPGILGARIANWISFFDFYGPAAEDEWRDLLWPSLARQMRHLYHTFPVTPCGLDSLRAIKGLVYGGLAFMDRDRALGLGFDLLRRQLAAEILPDGGHVSRNPSLHVAFLRILIDLREALRAANMEGPPEMILVLQRMLPLVKFFRHGDGRLALFNGSGEETALTLDAVLALSNLRCRTLHRLDDMGYERLTAGRSLLFVDTGTAPPPPYDQAAHAGLFGMEFSAGRERIIVNCGAGPTDSAWRQAMAATAAHSTLTLEDTNASDVLSQGGIGAHASILNAQRYERDGFSIVELSHNGYESAFGLIVARFLELSDDGFLLRGCETMKGVGGVSFALRWHLHPAIQASLIQDARAVLLRTASGAGWRLSLETPAAHLAIEPSIYCGTGQPRRSLQIKAMGHTNPRATLVRWSLAREKKAG